MVRSTRLANFVRATALAMVIAAGFAGAAVILEDDFTDPLASHSKWIKSPETVAVTVGEGDCAISNPSQEYVGEYLHTFSGAKPQVFTISYVEKSPPVDGGASLFFCRASALNGYALAVSPQGAPIVYRYVATNQGTQGTQISPPGTAVDMKPSNNKYTVSKRGSEFHVFVNDIFQFKFNDTQYASGDVSFMLNPGTSAVIGNFRMTDVFTPGSERASFSDDFSSSELKYWKTLSSGGTPVNNVANGALTMKNGAGVSSWMYVDMDIANFEARVEARYVAASTMSPYGIVLIGASPGSGQTIPMLHFAIRGERQYSVYREGEMHTFTSDLAINGAPPAGAGGMVDTLEVKKDPEASAYEFLVNGKSLLPGYAVVNFEVIGIGLFCGDNLEVAFDNFSANRVGPPTSINRGAAQISRRPAGAKKPGNTVFYDLRGRKRYTMTAAQAAGRAPVMAAGVYVNESRREVRVSKGGRR